MGGLGGGSVATGGVGGSSLGGASSGGISGEPVLQRKKATDYHQCAE